ncbi:hypothetical protein BJX61DRAFT_537581 [Aspergillus egyptiacus]|nr:hypothetical protein BJX61DRAFT_537581 [Aspergillus egyptiacus]
MPTRRLLIFQETPTSNHTPHSPSYNPLATPGPQPSAAMQVHQQQPQFTYVPINKLGLPIHGPGSLPEGLGLGSLLSLPLRVISAFTEIFNSVKYKGWAVVAAGPYTDPTLAAQGTFYAVVLEQVSAGSGAEGMMGS